MQIIAELRKCFVAPLTTLFQQAGIEDYRGQLESALGMIRPAQNAGFGDYQANFAMPLSKPLGMKSQDIGAKVVQLADLSQLCSKVEVAGPGFINLTLTDDYLVQQAMTAFDGGAHPQAGSPIAGEVAPVGDRLGVQWAEDPKTIVVDFSSPNVAKPMHVGHIRSTVIGDSVSKVCRYLGHRVITDNHLGDWGTQFGMIIYGYKHFGDGPAYQSAPVKELSRLYRLVRQIMDVLEKQAAVPKLQTLVGDLETELADAKSVVAAANEGGQKKEIKSAKQKLGQIESRLNDNQETLSKTIGGLEVAAKDDVLQSLVKQHGNIGTAVLEETSKLHAGDQENLQLWREMLPHCHDEIDRVYSRLNIKFDHCLGESFYHDQLAPTVAKLQASGLVKQSNGAQCIFLEEFDAPMIVQKRDGAFLYATTDLATIEYRMQHWHPDKMLYVVDHRQKEHFDKLFLVADKMGYQAVEKTHVSFGTVMGPDGKPYKTRSGDTVGLEGLIDEAVAKALEVVSLVEQSKKQGPEFSEAQRSAIAEVVGVGALKYGDLSQNRTSDYKFDFDQMVALEGNTATYLQYGYARVNGIFGKVGVSADSLVAQHPKLMITNDAERALLLSLVRFQDALEEVLVDYRPNLLCVYLFEMTQTFFSFYNRKDCHVDGAQKDVQLSRLVMCDLVARTIKTGLALLGIGVVEKM